MAEQVQYQSHDAPIPMLAPLTLVPLAGPDEDFPTFGTDRFGEMAAFVVDRMRASGIDEDGLLIESPTADAFPGRRLLAAGEPICRLIGDASDPRPLTAVVLGLLRAEAATR